MVEILYYEGHKNVFKSLGENISESGSVVTKNGSQNDFRVNDRRLLSSCVFPTINCNKGMISYWQRPSQKGTVYVHFVSPNYKVDSFVG